ncbi:MAG: hypothetical protein IIC00_00010 [Planctomycetes bacterium]|nr:hypothetical protein [Planctomycetota bacterium]
MNCPELIRRELALNKCGTSNPRQCRGLTGIEARGDGDVGYVMTYGAFGT